MIKRIIFDLDNTLIDWKEEYWESIQNALGQEDKNKVKEIKNAINSYELKYNIFKKEFMLQHINNETNLNLNMEFLEKCLEGFSQAIPENIGIIDTLEYLYNKYELVVLTNWFKIPQEKRLEKAKIRKYFKEIYAPEDFLIKPNKEAFYIASENNVDECIMVGDSFSTDIKGALNVGMKAIYITKDKKESNKEYITINNFNELINIL